MLLPILPVLAAALTCVIPAFGQLTCQSQILHNSTVDIDKYLNKDLHIIATFTSPPPDAVSDCTLQCCNQDNCSLAIYKASDNYTCLLIHCVSEDACQPLPCSGCETVKILRNNTITTTNPIATTTEGVSENNTKLSLNSSTTAITLTADNFTSQDSTTQGYNESNTLNVGNSPRMSRTIKPSKSTEPTTETLSALFGLFTRSVSSQDQFPVTEPLSSQIIDELTTNPVNNTIDQMFVLNNNTAGSLTTTVFMSNSSRPFTTSYDEMIINNNNSTDRPLTTIITNTTLIMNETDSNYVTSNVSKDENISVSTIDVNDTFSQSNDTTNYTLDNSTDRPLTTTVITNTTLIMNETDSLNYTNNYVTSNVSKDENISVSTIDVNDTFSQSNDTTNYTLDKSTDRPLTTTVITNTTLIMNETDSLNYTNNYVTSNVSKDENISVSTIDVNDTFSQSNDTTNYTLDNSTDRPLTTTITDATLIMNKTVSLNYTNNYVTSNVSKDENISVSTIDVNDTFSQSNDTTNYTLGDEMYGDSTELPNATFFKEESNSKDVADDNTSIMLSVLIGTLAVGTLLFVAVIAVISKKAIDGWQRRHYSRIDYLVNGMYN